MSADISFGFMLMAVGMISVFTILALVVGGGKVMILLINKYAPLVEIVAPLSPANSESSIESAKLAAITAAVESVTGGQGRITEIKKE